MKFLSVCSGIEAASVAWAPLGWKASAFSEIERFPCALLAHHYPDVPNLGDMTKFKDWPDDLSVDLLCGGTPCQSFSVAGLRAGLADPRGNLMLTYLAIAAKHRPKWVVWENVPGVLSSWSCDEPPSDLAEGQEWEAVETSDFGSFLAGLGELGYGYAYRILDAQYFGVPQRRRRVFVVGCLGDWHAAAAVLFERHSLQGHPSPRRQAGQRPTGTLSARTEGGGGLGTDFELGGGLIPEVGRALTTSNQRIDAETETFVVAHSLRAEGDPCHTLAKGAHAPAVAFQSSQSGVRIDDVHATLDSNNGPRRHNGALLGTHVRRLTPRECERLQGFPDDYTLIPGKAARQIEGDMLAYLQTIFPGLTAVEAGRMAADGPRYKALGNSWAVPCARWIGERIEAVNALIQVEAL